MLLLVCLLDSTRRAFLQVHSMGLWIYLLLFSLFITFFLLNNFFFFFKPEKNNGSLQAMAEQKNHLCHAMRDVNLNRKLCCKLHSEVQSITLIQIKWLLDRLQDRPFFQVTTTFLCWSVSGGWCWARWAAAVKYSSLGHHYLTDLMKGLYHPHFEHLTENTLRSGNLHTYLFIMKNTSLGIGLLCF